MSGAERQREAFNCNGAGGVARGKSATAAPLPSTAQPRRQRPCQHRSPSAHGEHTACSRVGLPLVATAVSHSPSHASVSSLGATQRPRGTSDEPSRRSSARGNTAHTKCSPTSAALPSGTHTRLSGQRLPPVPRGTVGSQNGCALATHSPFGDVGSSERRVQV